MFCCQASGNSENILVQSTLCHSKDFHACKSASLLGILLTIFDLLSFLFSPFSSVSSKYRYRDKPTSPISKSFIFPCKSINYYFIMVAVHYSQIITNSDSHEKMTNHESSQMFHYTLFTNLIEF